MGSLLTLASVHFGHLVRNNVDFDANWACTSTELSIFPLPGYGSTIGSSQEQCKAI